MRQTNSQRECARNSKRQQRPARGDKDCSKDGRAERYINLRGKEEHGDEEIVKKEDEARLTRHTTKAHAKKKGEVHGEHALSEDAAKK